MFLSLFGTVVIAGIVGVFFEKFNLTQNGLIPSIIIAIGGAFLFYFVGLMFKISLGSSGLNAIAASAGALLLITTGMRR